MSTHNTCFHGDIRKISVVLVLKVSYSELCKVWGAFVADRRCTMKKRGLPISWNASLIRVPIRLRAFATQTWHNSIRAPFLCINHHVIIFSKCTSPTFLIKLLLQ